MAVLPGGWKFPSGVQYRGAGNGSLISAWPTAPSSPAVWADGADYPITFTINWNFDDVRFYHDELPDICPPGTGMLWKFWFGAGFLVRFDVDGGNMQEVHILPETSTYKNRTGTQQVTISIPAKYRNSVHQYRIWINPLIGYYFYNLGCWMIYNNWTNAFEGAFNGPNSANDLCPCQSPDNAAQREDGYWSGECSRIMQIDPAYYTNGWPGVGYPYLTFPALGYSGYNAVASFTIAATQPLNAPKNVQFDATKSTGDGYTGMSSHQYAITSYAWDFGDGTSGSGVQPNHEYAKPGTYTIKLTISTASGATATSSQSITIGAGAAAIQFTSGGAWPGNVNVDDNIVGSLEVKNEGGTASASITFSVEGKTGTVVSNQAIAGYGNTQITIPGHPISWYLGYTPSSAMNVTFTFAVVGANGTSYDSTTRTTVISMSGAAGTPGSFTDPYDYSGGWQGNGYYVNVPGEISSTPIPISTETDYESYGSTPTPTTSTFWSKYGKKVLIGGGIVTALVGAVLLAPTIKKKS